LIFYCEEFVKFVQAIGKSVQGANLEFEYNSGFACDKFLSGTVGVCGSDNGFSHNLKG
jgi:hypothetical protein